MTTTYHADDSDFEIAFNDDINDFVASKIRNYNFSFRTLSEKEYDQYIIKMISTILELNDNPEIQAGKHRIDQWESGWGENYILENIIPKYFGKYPVVRWLQDLVKPNSLMFEYNMFAMIQYWLFNKYLRDVPAVYEFGCGTGHNLLRVKEINPNAKIWGLDWATSAINLVKKFGFNSYKFDMFNPDDNFEINSNGIVYTVASMEQLGSDYISFVDYLIQQKPSLVIHIEPIYELLDSTNLLDYLSQQYFLKRKYLNNYLTYLQTLEQKSLIKIIQAQRTYIGSLFIDGYSVIVWKPI